MCVIIDANVITNVLVQDSESNDFTPLHRALSNRKATAIYGGKLTREYERLRSLMRIIREMDRQGIMRQEPDKDVDDMTDQVIKEGDSKSDDPHIIALARVANVRLLCSHDIDLHNDFKNPDILQPAGSVYQNPSHKHLIAKHCGKRRTKK